MPITCAAHHVHVRRACAHLLEVEQLVAQPRHAELVREHAQPLLRPHVLVLGLLELAAAARLGLVAVGLDGHARLLLLQVLLVAVGVVHHVEERALPRLLVSGEPLGDLARARADGREDTQHRLPHPLVAALEPAVALVDGHLGHHRAAQDRLQLLEGTLEPRLARLPTAWGGARCVACRAGRRLSASRPWCVLRGARRGCVLWVRAVVKGMP